MRTRQTYSLSVSLSLSLSLSLSPIPHPPHRLLHVLIHDVLDGPYIRGEIDRRMQVQRDIDRQRATLINEVWL